MAETREELFWMADIKEYKQKLQTVEDARNSGTITVEREAAITGRLVGEHIAQLADQTPEKVFTNLAISMNPGIEKEYGQYRSLYTDGFLDAYVATVGYEGKQGTEVTWEGLKNIEGAPKRDQFGALEPVSYKPEEAEKVAKMKQALVDLVQARGTTLHYDTIIKGKK